MKGLSHLAGSPAVAGFLGFGAPSEPATATGIANGTGEPGSACHTLGRALCRLVDVTSDGLAAPPHDGPRRSFEDAGLM
jgi:hypothetical protein